MFQSVAQSECLRAADAAESAYFTTFSEDIPADEKQLEKEHQVSLLAVRMFCINIIPLSNENLS